MWNPQDNAGKTPSAWSDMEPGDGVSPGILLQLART
jgi:hypothetical protein